MGFAESICMDVKRPIASSEIHDIHDIHGIHGIHVIHGFHETSC